MANYRGEELIACHECDHLHCAEPVPVGAKANCKRCGSLLYRHIPDSLDRSLALYLTALILFVLANSFPFLSLEFGGRVVQNNLFSGGLALYQLGMGDMGLLVFLTSILFPFVAITGMLYLLFAVRFGYEPPMMGQVYRVIDAITPWGLISVFMLGILISIVKLQDLANVIIGPSFFALVALLFVYAAARANFDPRILWSVSSYSNANLTAASVSTGATFINCSSVNSAYNLVNEPLVMYI